MFHSDRDHFSLKYNWMNIAWFSDALKRLLEAQNYILIHLHRIKMCHSSVKEMKWFELLQYFQIRILAYVFGQFFGLLIIKAKCSQQLIPCRLLLWPNSKNYMCGCYFAAFTCILIISIKNTLLRIGNIAAESIP